MLVKIIKAGRPHFLVLGTAIYTFGAAWAALTGASITFSRLIFAALIVLLAQLSVNYSNEYFDRENDQPGTTSAISGGSGVLAENPGLQSAILSIALALMVASLLAGIAFIRLYDYPAWMILLLLAGNLAGWFYSAPPLRLSARSLGEIIYTPIIGFLVPAMGYLSVRGRFDPHWTPILVPLCLYSLASILVVELPDLEVDLAGGKRNWLVRWGRRFGFSAIFVLFLAGTGYFFLYPLVVDEQLLFVFRNLGFLSLIPLSVGFLGVIRRPPEREPATRIAIGLLASLLVFVCLADVLLIILAMQ
jgi:1,4-dihydroxy-2-naphthoate octaprenyltransferase